MVAQPRVRQPAVTAMQTANRPRGGLQSIEPASSSARTRYRSRGILTLPELLALPVAPREMLLAPMIPTKGLVSLYGWRGIGKTLLALEISYAVASGGTVLGWGAPQPRKVLHLDGEMHLGMLQERLSHIAAAADHAPPEENLLILAADHAEHGLSSLATPHGQSFVESVLDGVSLLVIDNLSSLAASDRSENEAESWSAMQEWLLKLRRQGVSVLLIGHAGKNGAQRGTSKREDVLDVVIALRRPKDYRLSDGARFEVHIEKARGLCGQDAEPFEAQYELRDGAASWRRRDLGNADLARVAAGLSDGLTVREIAAATGLSKSQVGRLKKQVR